MATVEPVAGNTNSGPVKGVQKAKDKTSGIDSEAGSFMAVLMQLLGQDYSPDEIKSIEAMVLGGLEKAKPNESGAETSPEAKGSQNSLMAALDLMAGDEAALASALKAGSPEADFKSDQTELGQLLKVLQGGKLNPCVKTGIDPTQVAPSEASKGGNELSDALMQAQVKGEKKSSEIGPVISNPEKGEIEIDLNALKVLLQKTSEANPATPEKAAVPDAGAAITPLSLEQAIGEHLKPILVQAAEANETDTVSIRIKDAGREKKFTLRKDMLMSRSAETDQSGTGEIQGGAAKNGEAVIGGMDSTDGKLIGSGSDSAQGNAGRMTLSEHEKILMKEMAKPAETSAGHGTGESEFSTVMVKYLSNGPEGQMEKLFYKEIDTPGLEKKTLLIKTEVIQNINQGETALAAGLTGGGNSAAGEIDEIKPQAVLSQVMDGIDSALKNDYSRVRMELNPPQLGTLDMDLLVSHDRVRLVIMADGQDVRNMLQGNMDQLRSSLEQQGLKMDGVNVFVQDRHASGQGNQNAYAQGGGQYYSGSSASEKGAAGLQNEAEIENIRPRSRSDYSSAGLSIFA